jgi:hypothetical protein
MAFHLHDELLEAVEKLIIDYSENFFVELASSRLYRPKAGWKPTPQSYRSTS